MKLSAPIYRLKRKARLLSRAEKIPLHQALDRIALEEGIRQWSLLSARASASNAGRLLTRLRPGDLALIGARPNQGKTLLSLEILVEAMKAGNRGVFLSLEYTERNTLDLLRRICKDPAAFEQRFELDTSDAISADFMVERLSTAPCGTVVVVDYLQALDQQRAKPSISDQIHKLKAFAHDKGLVMIFLSQIDRSYDSSKKRCPDIADVRLPNPLDLTLFSKTCFLDQGRTEFGAYP